MKLTLWKFLVAIAIIGGLFYFATGFDFKRSEIVKLNTTIVRGKSVTASIEIPTGRQVVEYGDDKYIIKNIQFVEQGGALYISYDIKANKQFMSDKSNFVALDTAVFDNEGNKVFLKEVVGVTKMVNNEVMSEAFSIPLTTFGKSELYRIQFWINGSPSDTLIEEWNAAYSKLSFDRMIDNDSENNAVRAGDVEEYLELLAKNIQ